MPKTSHCQELQYAGAVSWSFQKWSWVAEVLWTQPTYCWWFRNPATQLRLVVYPIINIYLQGGAGFLPQPYVFTFVCFCWCFFTLYRGKSPLNYHLGNIFPNHLKQFHVQGIWDEMNGIWIRILGPFTVKYMPLHFGIMLSLYILKKTNLRRKPCVYDRWCCSEFVTVHYNYNVFFPMTQNHPKNT